MNQNNVIVDRLEDGIVLVTLNRPEKRNALNISLMREFCQTIESLKDTRVLILQGAGPVFCAGLDLEEARNPDLELLSAELVAHTLLVISKAPFITIAAVEGAALAGGAGLMAACDFVVAAENVRIAFPEVLRGLVPALISSILARQVGWRALRELLLFGHPIEVSKAKEIGLVNTIVPVGGSLNEAVKWAKLSLRGAPEAVRLTKTLLDEINPAKVEELLLKTMSIHHVSRQSQEAEEGIKAFLENRDPVWTTNSVN